LTNSNVLLGFTVPEGKPCHIPLHHIAVTGMTSLSGKTTTTEAILRRRPGKDSSILAHKSLVFLTKRGEKTFADAHRVPPFYRERFDWEYVRGLLEASMHERLKFETPWIIRICKHSNSLTSVRRGITQALNRKGLRDFDRNIYTLLAAYLDKVLPVLSQAKEQFVDELLLQPGINVMDLTPWYTNEEVQMLVIRSCMEQILQHENDVIVALPEAWKMLPQSRNTPVKLYFEKFIREGATNGNYLIIDAQDLGGVDKTPLRQVSVWIMGKMMEANEVERLLKQTLGLKVPAKTVQTLPLGHFIVAHGQAVETVYVWPHGVPEEMAKKVARGELKPESVKEFLSNNSSQRPQVPVEEKPLRESSLNLRPVWNRIQQLEGDMLRLKREVNLAAEKPSSIQSLRNIELEEVTTKITVSKAVTHVKVSDSSNRGKILTLAQDGFFKSWRGLGDVYKALLEKRWSPNYNSVKLELVHLAKEDLLSMKKGGSRENLYVLPPNVEFE